MLARGGRRAPRHARSRPAARPPPSRAASRPLPDGRMSHLQQLPLTSSSAVLPLAIRARRGVGAFHAAGGGADDGVADQGHRQRQRNGRPAETATRLSVRAVRPQRKAGSLVLKTVPFFSKTSPFLAVLQAGPAVAPAAPDAAGQDAAELEAVQRRAQRPPAVRHGLGPHPGASALCACVCVRACGWCACGSSRAAQKAQTHLGTELSQERCTCLQLWCGAGCSVPALRRQRGAAG